MQQEHDAMPEFLSFWGSTHICIQYTYIYKMCIYIYIYKFWEEKERSKLDNFIDGELKLGNQVLSQKPGCKVNAMSTCHQVCSCGYGKPPGKFRSTLQK